VKLYEVATDALFATATSTTEIPSTGVYTASFVGALIAGTYRVVVVDDVTTYGIASYSATLLGVDTEKVQAVEFADGGGGDATEANQTAILQSITPITTVYTPQISSESISLISGDAYDGVSNNVLVWTASKSVNAQDIQFEIRDSREVVVLNQDSAGVTATGVGSVITVSLSSAATALLDPTQDIFHFTVAVDFSSDSVWTVAMGLVSVGGSVT
jgi:hypothetical protein